jgi:transcription initiation factor IIE alpha subunit
MSDLTVYAEALIATVARAFYPDEAVVVIDVLIRDKFLRDDDMAPRLSIPAKKLRQTLQFLQEEHLVATETVDDLAQGGSQATKFYYLDYNRAVHSIRLRVHCLRQKLEQNELRARSSSFYLCPGYPQKRCNGRYTEEDAQQVVDQTTGLFLCGECSASYENDPNPPPVETYTLQLVDNTKELKSAMDQLRRFNVQLSAKFVGSDQLRAGIYELLQKVRGGAGGGAGGGSTGRLGGGGGNSGGGGGHRPHILTSNLPSENFALGLGSKRLAGTGRTAGIKAKKLEQIGIASSAAQARNYLVDSEGNVAGDDAGLLASHVRSQQDVDLLRLTNAMGQKVQFQVERGGGARAQLLASRKQRMLKLMDAAATRVGVFVPLPQRVEEARRRKAQRDALIAAATSADGRGKKQKKLGMGGDTFEFLKDNIGRGSNGGGVVVSDSLDGKDVPEKNGGTSVALSTREPALVLLDDDPETTEEMRRVAFHPQYKIEMDRQSQLLKLNTAESSVTGPGASPRLVASSATDDESLAWEDGELF